ncbi:MAG TPA: GNAT family N-acetyltransferase [Burkholderiaceae bacterium]|nr:GNAT family N-acetyltransferase [Burkholderiaceae bacterium]
MPNEDPQRTWKPYNERKKKAEQVSEAVKLSASAVQVATAPQDFSDWESLLELLRTSFAYMDSRIDPPSSLQKMGIDELRSKAQQENLILATDGSELIGCAFAAVRNDCVYIGKIAVAERARGRGVARQLIAAAESIATTAGRQALELQTRVELVENHKTFAALGFEKVTETAHPGYTRPTSITMRKAIGP